jgi:molybdenum cofactor cytidylyltransferase
LAGIVGILLAAGAATRFGSNKLLHALPDGTPIAIASLRNLRRALPRVVAVIRPGAFELEELLRREGAEVTVCERADEGMGTTLAHAVRASRGADGWVIALADMPFIRPETIRRVVERLAAGVAVIAPAWEGLRGHPVGFAGRFGGALEHLAGDAGARELLKGACAEIELLDCNDPGVLRDIDRPEDLA